MPWRHRTDWPPPRPRLQCRPLPQNHPRCVLQRHGMALLFGRPAVLRRSARSSEVAAICCCQTCMGCALDVGTCTPGASCRCLLQMECGRDQGCPCHHDGSASSKRHSCEERLRVNRGAGAPRSGRSRRHPRRSPPHEPAHEARAACRRQPEREAEVRRRDGRSRSHKVWHPGCLRGCYAVAPHTRFLTHTQSERASVCRARVS